MLPTKLSNAIMKLQPQLLTKITEIRLRAKRAVAITIQGQVMYLQEDGVSYTLSPSNITLTQNEVYDVFVRLCNNSVYTHETEIAEGFISLPCGSRAGIAGDYVLKNDGKYFIKNITSINIRVASEVIGFANKLLKLAPNGNILICGAPNSGKTTLLRDYIKSKSNQGTKIALVDVRYEIASNGTLDVGANTDIASGGNKAMLIENALRSLAPNIIAFDEIGTLLELQKLQSLLASGVNVITTFHAKNMEELILRNNFLPILSLGVFDYIVFLNPDYNYTVERTDLNNAKTYGCIGSNSIILDDRDVVFYGSGTKGSTTTNYR